MRLFAIGFVLGISMIVMGSAAVSAEENEKADEQKTVVIEKGDTLIRIAKDHDTNYPRLFDANPKITDPDLIYPGQKIKIPTKDEKLAKRELPSTVQVSSYSLNNTLKPSSNQNTQAVSSPSVSGGVWDRLAACESGGNWSINTGNGYYGGLQFNLGTWQSNGGSGYPHQASKSEQIRVAENLRASSGFSPWPSCSSKLGLR